MNRKTETLLKRTEKAGVRKSLKIGHALNEEELLSLKVQIVPAYWRIVMVLSAIGSGIGACVCWNNNSPGWAILWGILAIFLLLFAIFGIKRTFSNILDGMDATFSAEFFELAAKGIVSVVAAVIE